RFRSAEGSWPIFDNDLYEEFVDGTGDGYGAGRPLRAASKRHYGNRARINEGIHEGTVSAEHRNDRPISIGYRAPRVLRSGRVGHQFRLWQNRCRHDCRHAPNREAVLPSRQSRIRVDWEG